MTIRLLGRRAAARRFARRDDLLVEDPLLAPLDPLVAANDPAAVVADVVAVDPIEKTYRATVTRTVTQTAVVEFAALEGTDTMTMAQGLLETIPAESWVTQPADSWGYIDQIDEVAAADLATLDDELLDPLDPLETPAALSRRRRALRRFGRKAAFDVTVDGVYYATYDAETAEDALAAYVAELGFATVDEAAAAAGITVEDFLAAVLVTDSVEAAPEALEDETALTPEEEEEVIETLSRRRRAIRSRGLARKMTGYDAQAEIDRILLEAQSATSVDQITALEQQLAGIFVDAGDPDESVVYASLSEAALHLAELKPLLEADAAVY